MKKNVLSMILIVSIMLSFSRVFAGTAFDYEPNDSPDTAYLLNGDTTLMSTISNINDVDFYNFNVKSTLDAVITLTSPQDSDYDIKLFDKNYNELACSDLPSNNDDIINMNSLKSGTYFIKVYCFNKKISGMPYTLSFKTNDINGTNKSSNAGQSEAIKKNTTMANALEINTNTSFNAKMGSYNETRYYKLKFNNLSDVNISMLPPKGADLDIKLYNSQGLEVGSSTNKSGIENISKIGLSPGAYYLKVYSYGFAFSSDTYEVLVKSAKSASVITTVNKDNTVTNNPGSTTPVPMESSPIDSGTSTAAPRALLLYVGAGLPYFSDEDIKKLLVDDPINTKEFIITDNGIEYNTYFDQNAGDLVDIVTPEKINALTQDKIDSTGKLDQIKADYLNIYKKTTHLNSLDYFANEVVDLALRLIKTDPGVKLSIAIPGTGFHALTDEFIEPVKEKIIKGIKEKLDEANPDYWENNIRGFYFSTEGIPYYYTWFKPDKTIDFNNPIVKTMVSLSNEIHEVYNKEFVWIPYYGNTLGMENFYYKDQFVRIGYIANRTNIFDYVFIQPSYYFKPNSKNIPYVKNSSELNAVVDLNHEIIGGIKSSKTLIGPEMEIDTKFASSSYLERYTQYVNAFSKVKSNTPVAFYAGSRDELFTDAVYNAVKSFFKSIQ